jgi:N-acyl-D-amino-acid deacylase
MQAARTIFKNGLIVDGTGAPAIEGEVVVADGRIISVGKDFTSEAIRNFADDEVVDCSGSVIVPGLIDAHSHSDLQILKNRREKLLQGVTSEVVGNCGFSPYPASKDPQVLRQFANGILCGGDDWQWDSASQYLADANRSQVATAVSLVGHGALRIHVAGDTSRPLTPRELERMCGLLEESLDGGATGFSSGLMYAPGSGASIQELTALARVAAGKGAIYATHMRSYSSGLVDAVEEQLEIARASECRLQISHLQAAGEDYWPMQQQAIAAIEQANADGVDVSFDAYPWLAGSTVLTQILPQWALDGGTSELLARLSNPAERERIRPHIQPEARWNNVVVTSAAKDEHLLVGRSIEQLARERGTMPEEIVMNILLEQEGQVNIVEHCQSRENLHALLTHPLATVVTDGVYTRGRSHPRLYATFPLLFGDIVRERKWMSLEEAVNKVTDRPAQTFHMKDRGRIAAGYIADLTVFNPDAIHTQATYEVPDVAPVGINSVWRNGKRLVNDGVVAFQTGTAI